MSSFFANTQRKLAAFRKRNSKLRHYFPNWALKYVAPFNYYYAKARAPFISVKHRSNNTNLYHCTQAKCGSIWISTLLRDPMIYKYSGMVVATYKDKFEKSQMERVTHIDKPFPQKTIVSSWKRSYDAFVHDLPKHDGPYKAFFVMRDPRDIMVSWYYSMKKTHVAAPDTAMKIDEHRELLNRVSMEEGIKYGIETYIEEGKFEVPRNWVLNGKNDPNVLLIKYEDLIGDGHEAVFKKIFDHLDIVMPPEAFQEMLDAYSFQSLTGRKAGQEDKNSHVRSGTAGDWKKYFTPELEAYFKVRTGDLVEELGYSW